LHGYDAGVLAEFHKALLQMRSFAHEALLLPFIYTAVTLDRALSSYYATPWDDYLKITRTLGCDLYYDAEMVEALPDISSMPRTLAALSYVTADETSLQKPTAAHIAFVIELANESAIMDPGGFGDEIRDRLHIMARRCEQLKLDVERMRESVQAMTQLVCHISLLQLDTIT
jgi:hypothetical protein